MWKDNVWFNESISPFYMFNNKYFPNSYFKDIKEHFHLMFNLHSLKLISQNINSFPREIMFANFQCLRCGLCCKNYEGADIFGDLEERLMNDGKENLLDYIWIKKFKDGAIGSTIPTLMGSCTLCRKVRNKPYYYCRIHEYKDFLPTCKSYICNKSFPVAHLNYDDIDSLIKMIGIYEYYSLIERDWGDDFDWSNCFFKTHKNIATALNVRAHG